VGGGTHPTTNRICQGVTGWGKKEKTREIRSDGGADRRRGGMDQNSAIQGERGPLSWVKGTTTKQKERTGVKEQQPFLTDHREGKVELPPIPQRLPMIHKGKKGTKRVQISKGTVS